MNVDAIAVIDSPLTGQSSVVVRGEIVNRVRSMIAGWCDLGGDLQNAVLVIHPETAPKLTGVAGEHRIVTLLGLPVVTDPKCQPGDVYVESMA